MDSFVFENGNNRGAIQPRSRFFAVEKKIGYKFGNDIYPPRSSCPSQPGMPQRHFGLSKSGSVRGTNFRSDSFSVFSSVMDLSVGRR
jgi:hypothetical protein